jgi:hypothetical protein
MKPKGLLSCLQEPATRLSWASWLQFKSSPPISLGYILTIPIFLVTPRCPKWSLPLRFSNYNLKCISCLSHPCYMPRPPNSPWFDHLNSAWTVQIIKPLIMLFYPSTYHFTSLSSKCSPQHPVLQHCKSSFSVKELASVSSKTTSKSIICIF